MCFSLLLHRTLTLRAASRPSSYATRANDANARPRSEAVSPPVDPTQTHCLPQMITSVCARKQRTATQRAVSSHQRVEHVAKEQRPHLRVRAHMCMSRLRLLSYCSQCPRDKSRCKASKSLVLAIRAVKRTQCVKEQPHIRIHEKTCSPREYCRRTQRAPLPSLVVTLRRHANTSTHRSLAI